MLKLVKSAFHDFTSEITENNNQYFNITNAYFENGVVFIEGVVKSGWEGAKQVQMIPLKYCPRISSIAILSYNSSNADMNKISAMSVNSYGNLYAWVVESLDYNGEFNFMYPLKSE